METTARCIWSQSPFFSNQGIALVCLYIAVDSITASCQTLYSLKLRAFFSIILSLHFVAAQLLFVRFAAFVSFRSSSAAIRAAFRPSSLSLQRSCDSCGLPPSLHFVPFVAAQLPSCGFPLSFHFVAAQLPPKFPHTNCPKVCMASLGAYFRLKRALSRKARQVFHFRNQVRSVFVFCC